MCVRGGLFHEEVFLWDRAESDGGFCSKTNHHGSNRFYVRPFLMDCSQYSYPTVWMSPPFLIWDKDT